MAGRRTRRPQRGAALLIFMIIAVTAALTFVVTNLTPEAVEARRAQKTQEALALAREALIGYALKYRDEQIAQGQPDRVYGYLPLPDLGTTRNNNAGCTQEGCDAANFSGNALNATVIGRLPWRTLGLPPLRDGANECLWYAVSGSHQRQQRVTPMNWDTLGHLDIVVANGTDTLASLLDSPHDRPIAVIFSPGPPLPGQDRSTGGDDVTQCGGNYDAANYLDPATATALGGVTNYLAGTNNSSAVTDADTSRKQLLAQGRIFKSGDEYLSNGCTGGDCNLVANDAGLPLTSDQFFSVLRKHAHFRSDINSLLDRITGCLRDQGVASGYGKIIGADDNECYGKDSHPLGYYPNYREMIFTAGGSVQVNGEDCAGALLFANQRGAGQLRTTDAQKNNPPESYDNYFEGVNLSSFKADPPGTEFSGQEIFGSISSTQTAQQDIVRCIPDTPSLVTVDSPNLTLAGLPQLTSYSAASRTLTLGQAVSTLLPASAATNLFGCAWQPESHPMGRGLRTYFKFRINDAGFTTAPHEGFAFAIVDALNNGIEACGAAAQHLGYSGNNMVTPFIAAPKIAFEVDPRASRNLHPTIPDFYFDETATNTLFNGRNDPPITSTTYRGGHVAFVYWGGDTPIVISPTPGTCSPPRITISGQCVLRPEEDDNVHGQAAYARTDYPAPPANPSAPIPPLSVPPDTPQGLYKLDPNRSQVPVETDIHVRVELTRMSATVTLPRVRVATTTSINLNAPGTGIDDVALFSGDWVLVKNQTFPRENGVYVWRGSGAQMDRAPGFDSPNSLAGAFVEVTQGRQHARSLWRQTATIGTLGTDPVRWHAAHAKLAVAQSAISLSSPGEKIDGVVMKPQDRVLVKELGVYVWNGATTPMTAVVPLSGEALQILQGSDASSWWRYDGSGWQRQSVRVATQSNINIASPGANLDGIAMSMGDRMLVRAQTNRAENGIYVWLGAALPLIRADDANEPSELTGALTQVLVGSDVGRTFRQTTLGTTGSIDTDPIDWVSIDGSPQYLLEAWILPQSLATADRISAMQNTTRPMSSLASDFTPHLRDRPIIAYPFRHVRIGFTTAQRRTIMDQSIDITNMATTWVE